MTNKPCRAMSGKIPIGIVLALLAFPSFASDYEATEKPPSVYAPLVWKYQGDAVKGYWFTDAQVLKMNARIEYLEGKATQECVTQTRADVTSSSVILVSVGLALLAGAGIGFFLSR